MIGHEKSGKGSMTEQFIQENIGKVKPKSPHPDIVKGTATPKRQNPILRIHIFSLETYNGAIVQ